MGVAHTHSIDKCFHKQSAEKNKNGKIKNKESLNKDSAHKKQLLMLTETINNILNLEETMVIKPGGVSSHGEGIHVVKSVEDLQVAVTKMKDINEGYILQEYDRTPV